MPSGSVQQPATRQQPHQSFEDATPSVSLSLTMSFDWAHQFCLACDKQTDGATYCSESCRLADYEKTSTTSSGPSSPSLMPPSEWSLSKSVGSTSRFYLSPAFDFGHVQSSLVSRPNLSPSTSHTSLCSMKSNASTTSESSQILSDKATRELRAYNRSLASVRLQRRRSY